MDRQEARALLADAELIHPAAAIQTALDSQYLYLASPLFGDIAVPRAELDAVWPDNGSGRVAFVLWTPADWVMPAI